MSYISTHDVLCYVNVFLAGSMPCPFLTRLSANYVRNYGVSVIMNYRQHCPVMSRLASSLADSPAVEQPAESASPLLDPSASKCPFLSKERDAIKEASSAVREDIINLTESPKEDNTFKYDEFFHEQIMRKKKDHSYRLVGFILVDG